MSGSGQHARPTGHTPDGGVVVGDAGARHVLLLFEDPQCPYCREFEEHNGRLISALVGRGELAVEYRMRCFLGPESVRADNSLALAAEADRFDDLRRELFVHQPDEGTGGFAIGDLLDLGANVGLTDETFMSGVREARYEEWVLAREAVLDRQDPQGTPAAWLDGQPVASGALFDPETFAHLLRG